MELENTIILDKDTEFNGEMKTGQLILEGRVEGVVRAKDKIILKKGSLLKGRVISGNLNMLEGSNFRGELFAGNSVNVFKVPSHVPTESPDDSPAEKLRVHRLQA